MTTGSQQIFGSVLTVEFSSDVFGSAGSGPCFVKVSENGNDSVLGIGDGSFDNSAVDPMRTDSITRCGDTSISVFSFMLI